LVSLAGGHYEPVIRGQVQSAYATRRSPRQCWQVGGSNFPTQYRDDPPYERRQQNESKTVRVRMRTSASSFTDLVIPFAKHRTSKSIMHLAN